MTCDCTGTQHPIGAMGCDMLPPELQAIYAVVNKVAAKKFTGGYSTKLGATLSDVFIERVINTVIARLMRRTDP